MNYDLGNLLICNFSALIQREFRCFSREKETNARATLLSTYLLLTYNNEHNSICFFAICEGILELDLFVLFFFCSGHFIGDFLEGNVEALQFPHATYLHCIMVQVGRVWNHANEQPCFN